MGSLLLTCLKTFVGSRILGLKEILDVGPPANWPSALHLILNSFMYVLGASVLIKQILAARWQDIGFIESVDGVCELVVVVH